MPPPPEIAMPSWAARPVKELDEDLLIGFVEAVPQTDTNTNTESESEEEVRDGEDGEEEARWEVCDACAEWKEDDGCAICLRDYACGDEIIAVEPCGHFFCGECTDQWKSSPQTRCPMCRGPTDKMAVGEYHTGFVADAEGYRYLAVYEEYEVEGDGYAEEEGLYVEEEEVLEPGWVTSPTRYQGPW